MDERKLETELQAKGLNAPRLTPDMINDVILTDQYHVFPGTVLTVCCLTLKNGFNVVGESAPASAANFDEGIGRKLAFEDARRKIWKLEGYALRNQLAEGGPSRPLDTSRYAEA